MRPTTIAIICLLTLAVAAAVSGVPRNAPAAQPKSPVPLKDIDERGVAGRLGLRLGTVMEVSGDIVPNTSRAKADGGEPFFLRINEVDGRKLETPQLFSSAAMPLIHKVRGLKVGGSFRCIGYESGAFQGSPGDVLKYVETYATQGFHFAVHFVVVMVKQEVQPDESRK